MRSGPLFLKGVLFFLLLFLCCLDEQYGESCHHDADH